MTPRDCIFGCWLAFIVVWSVAALTGKAVAERQSWRENAAYRIPMAAGVLFLFRQDRLLPLKLHLLPRWPAVSWTGAALCVLGLMLSIWARVVLAGNWSGSVTFKKDHELIERGPYRYARHPIYTGLSLMGLGVVVAAGNVGALLGLALIVAGLWIKLSQEEKLMTRHFPNEYPAYQARVKALVPFVL